MRRGRELEPDPEREYRQGRHEGRQPDRSNAHSGSSYNKNTAMSADAKPFHEPHLALNRIYTKRGDKGETGLVGGQRVRKDAIRIEAYGTVDELNSFIGMARLSSDEDARLAQLGRILLRVQHELFNLGSILATLPADVRPKQPRITEADIAQLEREIDEMNEVLPSLRSFVLAGGTRLNCELHVCRTICRRAERITVTLSHEDEAPVGAVQYLNRLSDALFVYSRWANHVLGVEETLWEPNRAASGAS
jgi:cob(I)alamin adenosyltransferase